jgi:hypothetical protein
MRKLREGWVLWAKRESFRGGFGEVAGMAGSRKRGQRRDSTQEMAEEIAGREYLGTADRGGRKARWEILTRPMKTI